MIFAMSVSADTYAEPVRWHPEVPKLRPVRLVLGWFVAALALLFAAWIVPHASIPNFVGALITALLVALINALIPPIVAALRIPFVLGFGFLLVLVVDAAALLLASHIDDRAIQVDSFWW